MKLIPSRKYDQRMDRKPFPSETQERFIVRFPDGMRDRIAEEAKKNNRSMNAEIVARLQASFANYIDAPTSAATYEIREPGGLFAAELKEQMERIESALGYLMGGIEPGEVGTPGVQMSPAATEPLPAAKAKSSRARNVHQAMREDSSVMPFEDPPKAPQPTTSRYPKPRK